MTLSLANRPAEVLEQATLVSGEQRFGVDGHAFLLLRTPRRGDPLDGYQINRSVLLFQDTENRKRVTAVISRFSKFNRGLSRVPPSVDSRQT